MKYADFRDWAFDLLFKTLPAEDRLQGWPDSKVKSFMQLLAYGIDKAFIYFFLFIALPALFILSLYVAWQRISGMF